MFSLGLVWLSAALILKCKYVHYLCFEIEENVKKWKLKTCLESSVCCSGLRFPPSGCWTWKQPQRPASQLAACVFLAGPRVVFATPQNVCRMCVSDVCVFSTDSWDSCTSSQMSIHFACVFICVLGWRRRWRQVPVKLSANQLWRISCVLFPPHPPPPSSNLWRISVTLLQSCKNIHDWTEIGCRKRWPTCPPGGAQRDRAALRSRLKLPEHRKPSLSRTTVPQGAEEIYRLFECWRQQQGRSSHYAVKRGSCGSVSRERAANRWPKGWWFKSPLQQSAGWSVLGQDTKTLIAPNGVGGVFTRYQPPSGVWMCRWTGESLMQSAK